MIGGLTILPAATPDGQIESSIEGLATAPSKASPLMVAEPIDALVARTLASDNLSSDNLRLEHAGEKELAQFRDRFKRSLALVTERLREIASGRPK
ncbi:MAG: hypothetical protein GEU91_00330 [Rhizobiales bacterium]|nr:hypothetical protein [Hyphomicrobiales bacterium]